jgi:hypothetical protein
LLIDEIIYVQWGFGPESVLFLFENYIGIQGVQQRISTSNLKQPPVDARSSRSLDTKDMDNAEKHDFEKRNALERILPVAMLVNTFTFAAAFTMPGGYKSDGPDQGLANKAFAIFVTTAFLFSVTVVGLQLGTSRNYKVQIRYMNVAALCTSISIIGMALASVSGMYVVLAESTGLAITAYVVAGFLALSYTLALKNTLASPNFLFRIDRYRIYLYYMFENFEILGVCPLRAYSQNT